MCCVLMAGFLSTAVRGTSNRLVASGGHLSGDLPLVTIGQGRTPQGRGEEWVRLGHLITIDHMTTILLCHWSNSLLKH